MSIDEGYDCYILLNITKTILKLDALFAVMITIYKSKPVLCIKYPSMIHHAEPIFVKKPEIFVFLDFIKIKIAYFFKNCYNTDKAE